MQLTLKEVETLTGYVRPSKQIEWLEDNGFRRNVNYFVNAAGYPIVWTDPLDARSSTKPELGPVT